MRWKLRILTFVAAVALLASTACAAGSDDAVVGITATVDTFAEWADATPAIGTGDWTGGTVSAVGEDLTVTKALTLYANTNVTVTPSATDGNAAPGTLTTGADADTLTTSYKVTGDVDTPDGSYLAAGTATGEFFDVAGNDYTVSHAAGDGSYTINLLVKAESDDAAADDAGDYTAEVTMTAAW